MKLFQSTLGMPYFKMITEFEDELRSMAYPGYYPLNAG
jgi:hypothetical protein